MENKKYEEFKNEVISMLEKDSPNTVLVYLNDNINKNPNFLEAYLVRGEIFTEKGDFQESLSDFDKVIKIDPYMPHAYYLRGLLYAKLKGDTDKAFNDFNKTIEIDNGFAAAYANRGNMYLKMGEFQKAIADCTKAIEIAGDEMEPYFNRGLAYMNLEEPELAKALDDYNKVIKINPENAEAYAKRGLINQQFDNIQEAISDFEKFLELDPDNKNAKLVRDALKNLKKGKSINDDKPEFRKHLIIMIVGLVLLSVIGLMLSINTGYWYVGLLIGVYFGIGIGPIGANFKNEFEGSGSIIWGAAKSRYYEAGFGAAVGQFFFGLFLYPIWLLIKVFFKSLISPFVAIYQLVKSRNP